MDAARRSRHLRLRKTCAARGARACRWQRLPVRRSDRRPHARAARPALRPYACRRRLCAAHETRFAPAIRAAHPGRGGDEVADLTWTKTFVLTAIAYLQPVTRGEISRLAGREISRDVIASLKRCGLIDGAIRAPQPGAPFACVTTRTFLEAFGFASLRDLPDLERLKAEGVLQLGQGEDDFDGALGPADEDEDPFENAGEELDTATDL
jgi:hypothetical protein